MNDKLKDAVCCQNIIEAESLIESGADVNFRYPFGLTVFHDAAWSGDIEMAKLLIKHGARINMVGSTGCTPIQAAILNKQNLFVRYLVEEEYVDVNQIGESGSSPIQDAAIFGDMGIVKFLLTKGANAQRKNPQGLTAAQIAHDKRRTEIAELIKKHETSYQLHYA